MGQPRRRRLVGLGVPFGIVDPVFAPTPAMVTVLRIYLEMGLESAHPRNDGFGPLNDAVKRRNYGLSHVGGLSGIYSGFG